MPSPQAGAPTTPPPQRLRSSNDLDTFPASKDASEAPTTPPPPTQGSSSGLDTSTSSKDAFKEPTTPPPQTLRSSSGLDTSPTSKDPRRGGRPSTASRSPASISCPTVEEPVTNGHDKAAADTGKKEGVVPSVMDQTTSSDAVSDSKQKKEDLDLREGEVKQWEQELDRREQEMEQREKAVIDRDKRQYDRWLQLAEWETDLRQTHYAVQQGHARLSKWLKEADTDWTDRLTTVRRMEDEVRCEKLKLKAKEEEKEKQKEKGKGKVNEDEDEEKEKEKEKEDDKREGKGEEEEKELTHGCFGSGFIPWNYGRRACGDPKDEACLSLKKTLLAPQQSKPMPTPSGTPNPIIADVTAMTMRTSKPKAKVYQFETRLMAPKFQRPTTFNVGACPGLHQSTSGSKDPQMVKISFCVLTRPAENFNEWDLGSTIHETLKAVIAQYNASQLITESELVSWEIRKVLTERTRNFGISIDDVSIISMSFEKEFTHDTEETKQMTTQEDKLDNRSAIIKSQEDDQIWNKRQIGYIFDLGTALGLIFLIRPLLPTGYDRWMLVALAAVWGVGSLGLPIGLFGTSRFEKNWSRHVGRFISLSCSLLVIYGIYILTLRVTGAPEPTPSLSSFGITDGDADWWTTLWFGMIAVLVLLGHLYSWIRGCYTGGDRDNTP